MDVLTLSDVVVWVLAAISSIITDDIKDSYMR